MVYAQGTRVILTVGFTYDVRDGNRFGLNGRPAPVGVLEVGFLESRVGMHL